MATVKQSEAKLQPKQPPVAGVYTQARLTKETTTVDPDAIAAVVEAQRAATAQLTDEQLAKEENLAAAYNRRAVSKERLDAEIQRRNDAARRAKYHGREIRLAEQGLVNLRELVDLGLITEAQNQRQRARFTRRDLEMRNYWRRWRADLKPAPRTRDEELMLLDDAELMQLRNALVSTAVKNVSVGANDFTLDELDAEAKSRVVSPKGDTL